MTGLLRILAASIVLIVAACWQKEEKCACARIPMPSVGELDSAFYRESLKRTALVTISSQPEDALVLLDGTEIGVTPMEYVKLLPGNHRIEIQGSLNDRVALFDTTVTLGNGFTEIRKEFKASDTR